MNKILNTTIYSLAFGGRGVGKVDGKVCFVEGALPGEEITFEVIRESSNYFEGRLKKIIIPSKDRVQPVCRYYDDCGGCQLQHLDYQKELYYKEEQFKDLISRISGIKQFDCEKIIPAKNCYNYRTSITVHQKEEQYGFFAGNKKDIIEIKECSIAEESINEALADLSQSKNSEITLKSDLNGNVWSSAKTGERFYKDTYRGKDVFLSPKAFSQANRFISEEISRILEEWIGEVDADTAFFDVYCGSGFFSFLIENSFDSRIGMDSNSISIDCAKTTIKNSALEGYKFYKCVVEEDFFDIFHRSQMENNVVLIDPPRAGAKKEFLHRISKNDKISKIYYISCDPARLARDLKILIQDGKWKLNRACPFDMFPRTKHIEALAELTRISE